MNNYEQITSNVTTFRKLMREQGIDLYLISTADYHGSEYVGDYFKERAFLSGFTGSAGSIIITLDEAILWTDGRYFLQAEEQIKNTPFVLYKMGEKGVLTITEYIKSKVKGSYTIAFDGRTISTNFVLDLQKQLKDLDYKLVYDIDLVNQIWTNRPAISAAAVKELDVKYTGETRESKIGKVRAELIKAHATHLILTSLDDIAYLLNIRGGDVEYNPVVLSYAIISNDHFTLYINEKTLSNEIIASFNKDNIIIKNYNDIYQDVKKFDDHDIVMMELGKVNYALYANISKAKIINKINPTTIFKAIKNQIEIKNMYDAHVKDGVALTKFIYWLKNNVGKMDITEISAADVLETLRAKGEHYQGLSFETISGYAHHGAIIHYGPTKESDIHVLPKSFLLVDSGAQYDEGTTDVTRTISLGNLTAEEKFHYTLVLKAHLALGRAIFKEGTTGNALDILARKELAKYGLDFNHGTGHGVGYYLNVHEGPQNISAAPLRASYPFKEGMITSNEPGLYFKDKYGIRIENLTVCLKHMQTEYGTFLKFDELTFAPYDVEAIDMNLLTTEEKTQLHTYHQKCYDKLSPSLTEEESNWLKKIVEAI